MFFLYRYGKYVEWVSTLLIVIAMVLWQFQVLDNRITGSVVVVGFILYWGVVLPRMVHEQDH